ncbi:hypothetical protein LCGC14_2110210 [marine sediment metagenome]|uniref:Uncharacterized protein n=1 Tax=marine sediment metagenome TaxID=412755 RepID=A0A0F9E7E5_9ZZZZ
MASPVTYSGDDDCGRKFKMRLAAHVSIKDDAFYIDMALKSVAPNVEGIYVQDQSSTDGTPDVVREMQKLFPGKIVLETVPQPYDMQFHKDYNEVEYRNRAVKKTIELFNPDFICKLDADEIITQSFFDTMRGLDLEKFNAVCVSESRFISRKLVSRDLEIYGFKIAGHWYYGGHILFWRASLGTMYAHNPSFPGCHFHPILQPDPAPYYWMPGNYHIHLHRTFGPKAFRFWAEGGDEFEKVNPFNAREMAPKWFNAKENLGTAEEIEYDWPDYVLEKWKEWGIWD